MVLVMAVCLVDLKHNKEWCLVSCDLNPFLFDITVICCGSLSSTWHVCSIH